MKLRKGFLTLVVLVPLALGFSQAAHAQTKNFTFDFSDGSGSENDLTGTLFTTNTGNGTYTATSGSLILSANAANEFGLQQGTYALAPAGTISGIYGSSDNLLYPSGNSGYGSGVLTANGLLFGDPNNYYIEIQAPSPQPYVYYDFAGDSNLSGGYGTFTVTPAAVPELSSMLGFGSFVALGGLALLRRRRRTANA